MYPSDRSNLKIWLLAALFVMLASLIFTGSYVYRRYTNVLDRVKDKIQPNFYLLKLEEINTGLIEVESMLQNFYLSGEEEFVESYYREQNNLRYDLNEILNKPSSDSLLNFYLYRLDEDVRKLMDIYEKRYLSPEDDRVETALNSLKSKLEQQASNLETIKAKVTVEQEQGNSDATPDLETSVDTAMTPKEKAVEEKRERRGFINWLLGKEDESTAEVDTEVKPEKKESKQEQLSSKENTSEPKPQANTRSQEMLDSIKSQIASIGRAEELRFSKVKEQFLFLHEQEKRLKANILRIRNKIEEIEKTAISNETAFAEAEIESTNKWIGVILLFLILLISLTAYVVIKNIERNKAYLLALRSAKAEAEELAKTKSRFLANMSHELRTPLNAILGFTDQIMERSSAGSKDTEQLGIVKNAAGHLLDVVNEVLDYTKLSSNTIRIKHSTFSLHQELERIHLMVSSLANEAGLESTLIIQPNTPDLVKADLFRIRQCLLNLLGNAIKFTDEGSVTLKVGLKEEIDQHYVLSFAVIDTGIGISKEEQGKIFNEFEQVTTTGKSVKGTGLGLAITKRLVELMEGKIKLESQVGWGTTITMTLKALKPEDQNISAPPKKVFVEGKNLRVLIADDEEYNIKLLSAILDKHNIVHESATNGSETIALAAQSKFDALVIDQRMPGKTGLEVLKELKADYDHYRHVPAVLLSAAEIDDDTGFVDGDPNVFVVKKPFKETELLGFLGFSAIKSEVTTTEQEGINIEGLYRASGGDHTFVINMLEEFKKNAENSLQQMLQGFESEDYNRVAEVAHRFKPSCKHLGLDALYEILDGLETEGFTAGCEKKVISAKLAAAKIAIARGIDLIDIELDKETEKNEQED
ncbi:ATP-binding protein [Luteibaculum oceani]|uniref:histidine kinase n=1 Tax=Luteibaculum oceani TaxID=1294296 RepID=A0A5C6UYP2_9FLAO|nr:ATP-binding protein [Luteibaculum oceani]TXC78603.1 response regulator [Luteibaculum oceani]